jgi:protein-L-isoaspartate(D-aspartate) O-methyltransferase
MIDFARLRQAMVDGQIRVNDVTDPGIVAAMLELPRERFVPAARRELAYLDDDLLIQPAQAGKAARYLMEPMVLAKLVQALGAGAGDKVLDVGCATGYSAALLGRLAAEVIALEEDSALAETAGRLLAELDVRNVKVVSGSLVAGWPATAPYDAILLQGSVEVVPEPLFAQLKEGGRLGAVVRSGSAARATIYTRIGASHAARSVFDAAVPALPGFAAPKSFVF